MSTRLGPNEIHSSIFKAVDGFTTAAMNGNNWSDQKLMDSWNKHQKVWWRVYGKGFILGMVAWVVAFAGVFVAAEHVSRTAGLITFFAWIIGASAHGIWAYSRNKRTVTPDELEALRSTLALTPLQRTYMEAVIDLYASKAMTAEDRKEILGNMNALMDEEDRLASQREALEVLYASAEHRQQIADEVSRLEERVQNATDEEARAAWASSLQIARDRLAKFGHSGSVTERIDAQRELISQTLMSFREMLVRLRNAPTAGPDNLDVLRGRVSQIREQSQALESAYDELRMLS